MAVLLRFDNGVETTVSDQEFRRILLLAQGRISNMKEHRLSLTPMEVALEERVIPHLTKKVNGYG